MKAAVLLFVLALTACASGTSGGDLVDREWTLVSPPTPAGISTPTIRFGSDGRLNGNTGCNIASGSYTTTGDQLTIGSLIETERACLDDRGNQLEREYVRALEGARRFRIAAGGELELLGERGEVVARFR